jgi:N-glycosylase/DNA lyase
MLIKIPKSKFRGPFNLKLCIDSEQCPSDLWQFEDGKYKTSIKITNRWIPVEIWEDSDILFIRSQRDVSKKILYQFWADYDVLDFYSKFRSDKYLSKTIKSLKGLRVMRNLDLNWGVLEAICTQNSSVKQIRKMERNLRKFYGNGFTIDIQKLANTRELELKAKCKVGYRARCLINTARLLKTKELDFEALREMDTKEARKFLLKIKGVGPKVADIILLYSFGKPDTFPMDVWLRRTLMREYFKGSKMSNQELRNFALNYFGNHAGIAHLYIFCYERKILVHKEISD